MEKISKNSINPRQLAICAFLLIVATKFFALPILLMQIGGRMGWIVLATFLLLEVLILFIFIFCSIKQPKKDVFELIENALGKVVSKTVFTALLLLIVLRVLLHFINIGHFVSVELISGMPSWITLLPLALLLVVFGTSSLRSIARLSEVAIFFIVPAIALVIFLVAKTANTVNFLPFLGGGGDATGAFTKLAFLFFDVMGLFIIVGKVKPFERKIALDKSLETSKTKNKTLNKKTIVYPLIYSCFAVAVTFTLYVLVFSTYVNVSTFINPISSTAVTHTAISRFSLGRFDRIAFLIIMKGVFIVLGLLFYSLRKTASYIIGREKIGKHKTIVSLVLAAIIYILALSLNSNEFSEFIYTAGIYIVGIVGGGFILLLLVVTLISKKAVAKNEET